MRIGCVHVRENVGGVAGFRYGPVHGLQDRLQDTGWCTCAKIWVVSGKPSVQQAKAMGTSILHRIAT